jgi:hypothetical protein
MLKGWSPVGCINGADRRLPTCPSSTTLLIHNLIEFSLIYVTGTSQIFRSPRKNHLNMILKVYILQPGQKMILIILFFSMQMMERLLVVYWYTMLWLEN